MTFKEFKAWCNDRAADGCWSMMTALFCIDVINDIKKIPFWKRERIWKEMYEEEVVRDVVLPINRKLSEIQHHDDSLVKEES